jgi:SAM-dependent methyltransferase
MMGQPAMPDVNIDFDLVAEFYDVYVNCDFDLDFWRSTAQAMHGPRLELMCGTGRIAMAILRDGVAIEGLDYSVRLLDVFRSKLAGAGLETILHHGDARRFDLGQRYGLIFLGFHAIAEVISDRDKLDVFRDVHRHLADDGEFWISIHNPPQRRAGLDGIARPIGSYHLPDTGVLPASVQKVFARRARGHGEMDR